MPFLFIETVLPYNSYGAKYTKKPPINEITKQSFSCTQDRR